jgi:hypothetical protein
MLPLLLERVGVRRVKSHFISPSSQPSPSREKEPVLVKIPMSNRIILQTFC